MAGKTITLLDTAEASKYLTERLGPKPLWLYWLGDNRKPQRRHQYRVPYVVHGKRAYYAQADLERFIQWEKQQRTGIIEAPVKPSGRVAEITKAFGLSDNSYDPEKGAPWETGKFDAFPAVTEGGKRFIRLTTPPAPLGQFRLTAEQARQLGHDLLEATRHLGELEGYATVHDDAETTIMRRIA